MVTREQVKMARAALGWTVQDLAAKAGIAGNTVSRYKNGTDAYGETLMKLQRALELGGVSFIEEDEEAGPGVRLKKRRAKR